MEPAAALFEFATCVGEHGVATHETVLNVPAVEQVAVAVVAPPFAYPALHVTTTLCPVVPVTVVVAKLEFATLTGMQAFAAHVTTLNAPEDRHVAVPVVNPALAYPALHVTVKLWVVVPVMELAVDLSELETEVGAH